MTTHKIKAVAFTLLLCMLLSVSLPGRARAEAPIAEWNRYNVVLVVDKSGSLCSEGERGTDPDGLRYEALKLFLGLLTERGNNVGTVVFDEHIRYESPVEPLEGMAAKNALIQTIQTYYPHDDTDIGKAMLRAVQLLRDMEAQNALPGMIILFSDGMTDFDTGDITTRMQESYASAQEALDAALEDGITISGIHLNVDGAAERGKYEFQVYTYETDGEYQEVKQAEDLTDAFRRLYQIINHTEYSGTQRVAFSDRGEAEIYFAVPGFGVEEVNLIVEGEAGTENVGIEVIRPDGGRFDTAGHMLDSARYGFVKVPAPEAGLWTVRLRGTPENWVDVSMVCNAMLDVALFSSDEDESFHANTGYPFTADISVYFDDPDAEPLTAEQLRDLKVTLVREELASGAVRAFDMSYDGGQYVVNDNGRDTITFPRDGDYTLWATVDLGEFKAVSDTLEVRVMPHAPRAAVDSITNMLSYGSFEDGTWVLPLPGLFDLAEGSEVEYGISDDYEGLIWIDGENLYVNLLDSARQFVFDLSATDAAGQRAVIPVDVSVPAVSPRFNLVTDIFSLGSFTDPDWEVALSELFDDPKGQGLEYTLSSDCGGAVAIDGDMLRVRLPDDQPLSFTLTATDPLQQSARVTFDLSVAGVSAKLSRVTNIMNVGTLHDFLWEIPLEGLFTESRGLPLDYAVSDDYDGAVTIEDGVLRVDLHELRAAAFTLTARNDIGREASTAFDFQVPGPAASSGPIEATIKTGMFQEGTWEREVRGLFSDPKGTALTLSLTDDFGGAAQLTGGVLRVNMKGLKKAAFAVKATDEYGLSAEVPITLTEKNMTPLYLLSALGGAAAVGGAIGGTIFFRRRRE